jgi:hypothetical protein
VKIMQKPSGDGDRTEDCQNGQTCHLSIIDSRLSTLSRPIGPTTILTASPPPLPQGSVKKFFSLGAPKRR